MREVSAEGLWISLSYRCTGRVATLEASDDPVVIADLQSHFHFGQPVRATVLAVESPNGKARIDLSLRPTASPAAASNGAQLPVR